MTNNGVRNIDSDQNIPPTIRLEGDLRRTVKVGEPLALTAFVSDDGVPKPRRALEGRRRRIGLRVAWFVYRGAETVTFDPEQFNVYPDFSGNSPFSPGWTPPPVPPGGKYTVTATFSAPGTFVLRVMAHDGALDSTQDVTVTVNPPATDLHR